MIAQDVSQNFVMERVYLDSLCQGRVTTVSYYDGLGYGNETVSVSANGKSVYTVFEYDSKGRLSKSLLPFPHESSLSFLDRGKALSALEGFYNDGTAYVQYTYDTYDNQISSSMAGTLWTSKDKGDNYSVSTNTEADKVLRYEAPIGKNSLQKPGESAPKYYPAGALVKETGTDADGKSTVLFKDLQGNTVLERRDIGDTYFVFNILGQLRYVLTPMYQHSGYKELYAYEYRYDTRGNIVKRVLPGCKYIQYWYDRENRLVFMQDERLRTAGKYRFFTYDRLGRLVVQGLCEDCDRAISHKVAEMHFTRNATDFQGTGYTWKQHYQIDISGITLEKAIYYDDYDFASVFPDGYIGSASENDKAYGSGRMTGTKVMTSDGHCTYNANFYDAKGNLTKVWNKGLDGRSYTMACTYTLNGSAKRTELCASVNYGDDFLATFSYGYNSLNGKLSETDISIEHGGPMAVTRMAINYDDLDRVSIIARPTNVGNVTYGYDIHGWLRNIDTKTFKESLYYADGCGKPCYNGNVSSMTWQNYGYPQLRGYKFTYDDLDRLTLAEYGEREGLGDKQNRYDERMEYDLNGNIKRLQRRGLKQDGIYGKIDNLHVYLNGNRIDYVEDDAEKIVYSGAFDFNTAENGRSEFTYDGNGNLLSDTGRGIANIEYDEWNSPKRIQFSNGNVIKYVYTADGEKLRTVYLTAMPNLMVPVGETHELSVSETLCRDTVEYMLGGTLILNNGRIDKFLFDGGYFKGMRFTDSCDLFSVYFYNRDHLGNNRETLDAEGNVVQVTNYYPFGAPFCDDASSRGTGVQQYKYNGKELDMTHGLNTYDYGARQYYAPLATWDRMDKMAEEYYWMTPYAYCLNNPIKLRDKDGLRPGDFFNSMDDAAKDFGLFYNDNSIREKREYASFIYKVTNRNGEIGFSYYFANRGKEDVVKGQALPNGHIPVAYVHSHGASTYKNQIEYYDNEFSGIRFKENNNLKNTKERLKTKIHDIGFANKRKMNIYVVTPNGTLQKYNYKTGKIKVLSNEMPSDKKDPDRMNNINIFEKNCLSNKDFLEITKNILYEKY